jgi:hypothetical protein
MADAEKAEKLAAARKRVSDLPGELALETMLIAFVNRLSR